MRLFFICLLAFLSINGKFSSAQTLNTDSVYVPIAPMENFSGMGRLEILDKRKKAVGKSVLSAELDNYSPSSEVFQIESGLPWISAYEITCYGHGTNGQSRESFAILNPLIMYYPLMAAYKFSETTGCSEVDYLLVNKLNYRKEAKLITARIDYTSFYNKNKVFYKIHLSDTNARDLGYNFAYASVANNIRFAESRNLSNTITPTRGFYHRGGSCGVAGGCNNYSPRQTELEFYITSLPAELYIKLWKNRPADENVDADMNYRLIFE